MRKEVRIFINIIIFIVVAGFIFYIVRSLKDDTPLPGNATPEKQPFASPYKPVTTFYTNGEICCFELYNNRLYAVIADSIHVFDISGKHLDGFAAEKEVRDILIVKDHIYLLHSTAISVYSLSGEKTGDWEACSDRSDYCAMAYTSGFIFVTDATNKNICKYTTEGGFITFIKSPKGFIIPSYSFDIINIRDTLYCVNSGRHQIESYTIDGDFIASFGKPGEEPGAFAGCCNPAYITSTLRGDIITSEKGAPRISLYNRAGKFEQLLFEAGNIGGGIAAYEIKTSEDNLFVAGKKSITIYQLK